VVFSSGRLLSVPPTGLKWFRSCDLWLSSGVQVRLTGCLAATAASMRWAKLITAHRCRSAKWGRWPMCRATIQRSECLLWVKSRFYRVATLMAAFSPVSGHKAVRQGGSTPWGRRIDDPAVPIKTLQVPITPAESASGSLPAGLSFKVFKSVGKSFPTRYCGDMAIYHIERLGVTIYATLDEARPFMAISRLIEACETYEQYCELAALRRDMLRARGPEI
jgi:hypothetical protein